MGQLPKNYVCFTAHTHSHVACDARRPHGHTHTLCTLYHSISRRWWPRVGRRCCGSCGGGRRSGLLLRLDPGEHGEPVVGRRRWLGGPPGSGLGLGLGLELAKPEPKPKPKPKPKPNLLARVSCCAASTAAARESTSAAACSSSGRARPGATPGGSARSLLARRCVRSSTSVPNLWK